VIRPGEPGDAAAVAQIWRDGWRDEGAFDYEASVEDGSTVVVPCRRYVKDV
jgi:hypothetical protein